MARVRQLLQSGAIGTPREVQSTFTFVIQDRGDIRLSSELAGGALADVGCYCVALARYVFESDPTAAVAWARYAPEGVDEELAGVLSFTDDRRLTLSCGFALPDDTFSRVLGTEGEIRFTNAWHPTQADSFQVTHERDVVVEASNQEEPSFTDAVRHINAVVRGREEPRHLAIEEAMGNAVGIDLLRRSAQSGQRETV
jgi:predicted dehydrogenase